MTALRLLRSGTSALCLALGACGTAAPAAETPLPAGTCSIDGVQPDLSIALTGSVSPTHAPVPRNAAERLLFRQLYETLVTIDCEGRVAPGLAESWTSVDDGRVWYFRLRADAAFTTGAPVTAYDVMRSWSVNGSAARGGALLLRVEGSGNRELRVELTTSVRSAALFAAPLFAVAEHDSPTAWPAGTTAFRVDSAAPGRIRLRAHGATLTFTTITDARRALDADFDALLTSDAATLAYARALPGYDVIPLAWSSTWLLAGPQTLSAAPPREALESLARDVVRGDARPASDADPCSLGSTPAAGPTVGRRDVTVFYPEGQAVGLSLAERIIALAWPVEQAPAWLRPLLPVRGLTAVPITAGANPASLAATLAQGGALAHVIAVPRLTGDACIDAALDAGAVSVAAAGRALAALPLVETRQHAVVRRAAAAAEMHGDGMLRFRSQP